MNLLLAALQLEIDAKRRQMYNFLLHRGANYWDIDNETGPSARLACLVGAIIVHLRSRLICATRTVNENL